MTKKDYRAFAELLHIYKEEYSRKGYCEESFLVDQLANDMCRIFARDNSRFDSARFLAAVREGLVVRK